MNDAAEIVNMVAVFVRILAWPIVAAIAVILLRPRRHFTLQGLRPLNEITAKLAPHLPAEEIRRLNTYMALGELALGACGDERTAADWIGSYLRQKGDAGKKR
jgi:hypothetical protein